MSGSGLPVGDLHDSGFSVDLAVPARALAIGAHPDDIEFGCGGTLAKWAAAGCAIHHLVLTDGSRGTWDLSASRAELVSTRRREQREAARRLGGGDVDFLDWVDGELESGIGQRREVCAVIRRIKPDVVLGHDPWRRYRLHPDHRNAGWLTVDGVVAAREPTMFPDLGDAHRADAVLLWEADEPNHVETVPEGASVKLEALFEHRSQYRSTMGITAEPLWAPGAGHSEGDEVEQFSRRVRRQLAQHGALAGVASGEAFHLIDRV
ncbi:MAG: PIG-L deacetylase family protein [Acidimicrobiales bacterium]